MKTKKVVVGVAMLFILAIFSTHSLSFSDNMNLSGKLANERGSQPILLQIAKTGEDYKIHMDMGEPQGWRLAKKQAWDTKGTIDSKGRLTFTGGSNSDHFEVWQGEDEKFQIKMESLTPYGKAVVYGELTTVNPR